MTDASGRTMIGVVVHETKPEAAELARTLQQGAAERDLATVRIDGWEVPEKVDLVVGIGGDGTLLKAAGLAHAVDAPVVGVNLGKVGYLTDIEPEMVDTMLDGIVARTLEVKTRMAVSALTAGRKEVVGINDVVLEKVVSQRVVQIGVEISGQYFTTYRADGLIVATPVGSTAYSLSAGGPVVDPELEALILTPVAPHSLLSRSIILAADVELVFTVELDRPTRLNVDGREAFELEPGERLTVRRCDRPIRFLSLGEHPFPQAVRHQFGLDHA